MYSLKYSITIAEQKKLHIEGFLGASPLKKSQVIMTTWSLSMLVLEGSKPLKKILSQNRIKM
jgi:hypothetical protein